MSTDLFEELGLDTEAYCPNCGPDDCDWCEDCEGCRYSECDTCTCEVDNYVTVTYNVCVTGKRSEVTDESVHQAVVRQGFPDEWDFD